MRVLVTGATGYIGSRLVPRLRERGYNVRCFARQAARLRARFGDTVEVFEGDVADKDSVAQALLGCDAAYYLIHSMGTGNSFADVDRQAARTFGNAARLAGVGTIVYLGGLGSDRDTLSTHLKSRHEVGDILRASGVRCIEFRAALIIGSGSIGFEMMRYLTERLPVMVAPRWVVTRCQPIGIRDVLAYLIAALELSAKEGKTYEIGGSDVLTYRDMMMRYASIRALKRRIVIVPFFTPQLSSYWVHLVTPVSARLAQPLIRGLYNEVIVRDKNAERDFPGIVPGGFDAAVRAALDRPGGREATWFDALDLQSLQKDFAGIKEGVFIDMRVRSTTAPPERVAAVFSALGGRRGWLAGNALWRLRGLLDRAAGGPGLRRGRRSEMNLQVGDAVDFWRVEAYEPGRLLRLRAEMKLPGLAWLQFEAKPTGGQGALLRQTAIFEPRGLSGFLYWYSVALFHAWVFARLATGIVREAEKTA